MPQAQWPRNRSLPADPTRRGIVALLALDIAEPSKIAREIGRSRPATSRQLRLLHRAGPISVRRHYVDGRRVVYFIEPRRLGQIMRGWREQASVERFRPPPRTCPLSERWFRLSGTIAKLAKRGKEGR